MSHVVTTSEFSNADIQQLYEKVRLPDSYFAKQNPVPNCPVKRWNYDWKNNDFPRVWTILDFEEWVTKYNLKHVDKLAITDDTDPELDLIQASSRFLLKQPPYDLHKIHFTFQDQFDFFIFNQTLEHLYNPQAAVQSIAKTLKSGGYVFTSVPTLNIPHMTPYHFGGFTPMGLAVLFQGAGFEVLEIGQWGSYKYIEYLWRTQSWPGYSTLKDWNNCVPNERDNVCQCWILARKL